MKSEDELYLYFTTKLLPALKPLEDYRIEKVKKLKKYLIGAIISSVLILFGIVSKIPFLIFILSLPMFYYLGFAYQTFSKMSMILGKHFKNETFPDLLSFLFEEFEYIPNQKIAKRTLEKSMLFSKGIAFVEGEDFMKFKIGNTFIMFCETKAFRSNESAIFRGVFISATFNKNFNSKTFVLPSKTLSYFQNIKKQLINNFQRVKLEDMRFSKEFTVLSTDQVEARYILTTSLMQRILDYKKKTRKGISFSFVDNRLYCAIPNYLNHFEPALFEPYDFEFIKRNYYPIKLYTDLVDDLNLNLRIWSKGK
jgi:hypothetical protein